MKNLTLLFLALSATLVSIGQSPDDSFSSYYHLKVHHSNNELDTNSSLHQFFDKHGRLTKQILSSIFLEKFPELYGADSVLYYPNKSNIDSIKYFNTSFDNVSILHSINNVKIREKHNEGFDVKEYIVDRYTGNRMLQNIEYHKVNSTGDTQKIETHYSKYWDDSSIYAKRLIQYFYNEYGYIDQILTSDSSANHGWRDFSLEVRYWNESGQLDSMCSYQKSIGDTAFKLRTAYGYKYEGGLLKEVLKYFSNNDLYWVRTYNDYDSYQNVTKITDFYKSSADWYVFQEIDYEYDKRQRLTLEQFTRDGYTDKHVYVYQNLPPTNVTEIALNTGVRIFPNPVTDQLMFSTDENISQIQIFDLFGSLVLEELPQSSGQINIENLQAGTYIVHLIGAEKIHTTKVVKL